MEKSDFIILVDMDDVLEDLQEAWINRLNKKFALNVNKSTVTDWNIQIYYPNLTKDEVFSPLFEEDFWENVNPKKDAIEILNKLKKDGYSIYLVTSSAYETLTNKFSKALWPYFPFLDTDHIIICNHKQLIKGHVLIDDGVHNLIDKPFKPSYYKILFTANPNKYFNTAETDIKRVSNWYEVYSIIERLFKIENELEEIKRKKEKIN